MRKINLVMKCILIISYELKFKVEKLAFHRKRDFVQSMAGFNPVLNVSNLWVALNFFKTSELKAWFQLVMVVRVEVGLIRSVECLSLEKKHNMTLLMTPLLTFK